MTLEEQWTIRAPYAVLGFLLGLALAAIILSTL